MSSSRVSITHPNLNWRPRKVALFPVLQSQLSLPFKVPLFTELTNRYTQGRVPFSSPRGPGIDGRETTFVVAGLQEKGPDIDRDTEGDQ